MIGRQTEQAVTRATAIHEAVANIGKGPPALLNSLMTEIKNGGIKNASPIVGRLYTFTYDAKHKDTLPYWDMNPVILMINTYEDGFLGLNFHYLPLDLRVKCLYTLDVETRPRDLKTLMITWDIIKRSSVARIGKVVVKRYLKSHMRSKLIHIPASNWYLSLALPMARFQKKTEDQVNAISRELVK